MTIDKAAVRVVVAIIENRDGEFLIAERPQDKPAAGLWEFPGGKVERDEDDRAALLRELDEELGIDLHNETLAPFHQSRSGHLSLHFYRIRLRADIAPQGREGQQWRWVACHALPDYPFPAPNRIILQMLAAEKR